MTNQIKFQIGKAGITPGIIGSLLLAFKNHKQVRISLLKSSGRDRDSIIKMAEEISSQLSKYSEHNYNYKIIGFTIIIRKYAK